MQRALREAKGAFPAYTRTCRDWTRSTQASAQIGSSGVRHLFKGATPSAEQRPRFFLVLSVVARRAGAAALKAQWQSTADRYSQAYHAHTSRIYDTASSNDTGVQPWALKLESCLYRPAGAPMEEMPTLYSLHAVSKSLSGEEGSPLQSTDTVVDLRLLAAPAASKREHSLGRSNSAEALTLSSSGSSPQLALEQQPDNAATVVTLTASPDWEEISEPLDEHLSIVLRSDDTVTRSVVKVRTHP